MLEKFWKFANDPASGIMLPLSLFLIPLFASLFSLPLRFLAAFVAVFVFDVSAESPGAVASGYVMLAVSLGLAVLADIWLWRMVKKHHYSDKDEPQQYQESPEIEELYIEMEQCEALRNRKPLWKFWTNVVTLTLSVGVIFSCIHWGFTNLVDGPPELSLMFLFFMMALMVPVAVPTLKFHYMRSYSKTPPPRPPIDGTRLDSGREAFRGASLIFVGVIAYAISGLLWFLDNWMWGAILFIVGLAAILINIPQLWRKTEMSQPTSEWIKQLKKDGSL